MLFARFHRAKEPLTIFLFIFFCTLRRSSVAGQACSSSELTQNDFVYGYDNPSRINAQYTGLILEFPMENTIGVESTSISNMAQKYIDAEYDAETNSLRIVATAALSDYEKEQFAEQITLIIDMSCTGNTRRRLAFNQLFDDSNNHDPVFAQSLYTIELMLPLPRGFDLTFFQEISVRDLDIRNNQVTFTSSIDNSVVTVEAASRVGEDQKTFIAILKTSLQLLTLLQPLEFDIIATDSGTPRRSGRATIVLTANPDESFVPVPVFESAIYRGSLDENRLLTISHPVIKTETFNSEIAFGFSGGDSSLFTQSNEGNIITISLSNPLTDSDVLNRAVLMTTLVANRANVDPGNTVILVDIPTTTTPAPFAAPAFEKILYVGSLNVDRELLLEPLIITTETYDSSVTLSLEGDNAALFDVSNEGNVVTVKLLNELSDSDLVDQSLLTANVRASRENVGSGVASIAITTGTTTPVPVPISPRFERTFYEGSISRENQLSFEVPTIDASTYTSDVVFELEGDDASWFRVTNTANEITLQLDHNLVSTDLTRSYVIVRLWARHPTDGSGSTELIVKLPSLLTSAFNLGVTVGSIDLALSLEIPQLIVDPDFYTADMQFELIGADAILFTIANVENVLKVTLVSPLTEDSIKGRSYFRTEVAATNALNTRVGISVLIIDIIQPAVFPNPKFTLPAFRGSLDLDLALTFEDVLLEESTYGEDVVFSLEGGDEALFNTANTQNKVDVTLRQPLTQTDISDRTYLMTVLRAERPTHDPTATVLLVNIPVTTPRPAIIAPAFDKPLYRGSFHEETGFELEVVQLVLSTYSDAVTFELTGDDSQLFEVTSALNIVTISLKESVTDSELEDREFLAFEIVARHPEANLARSGVLISVPMKECPDVEVPRLSFENKLNVIHIKDTTIGVIGTITAIVESSLNYVLEYRLADHEYLSSRLSVDTLTGDLSLSTTLVPNTYSIEITATDSVNLLEGRSVIQITVESLVTCPEGDGVHVADTLLIKNLAENHAHEGLLSSVIEDCSFNVIDINPSNVEFVLINTESNQLDTIAFDREDDIFADMEVPQIQVTLQLRCPNESPLESFVPFTPIDLVSPQIERFITPQSPDNRWYTLASSIPYSERTTILNIIIEDENDNIPQFVMPFVDNQLFGYPEAQLAAEIMPPYLLKVVATDRDAGINAQVSYSLLGSNDFQVHRETGVVTPLRDAMQSTTEVRLTIRATDRNGAADGLANMVNVRVKRLEAKHISVITIEDEEIDEVDYVVEKIDEVASLDLRVLHSAMISIDSSIRSSRADGRLNVLRIYAYGFDSNGELLEATSIQETLKDFNANLFRLTSTIYENEAQVQSESTDTLGLIIACAVLLALLVSSVLATFLLWWFKVRPYEYRQMEDSGSVSSKQGLANVASGTIGTNGAPQSSPIMKIDRFEVQKRDSVALRGSTTNDTSDNIDSPQLLARRLANRLDVESNSPDTSPSNSQTTTLEAHPRRPTTGVRFNELVERIDIEVEPQPERNGNATVIERDVDRL